ncbi:MAG: V-type ATP synthase subunit F [bacterium]
MPKIAVIGDHDSILGFKAVGVTAFPVTEPEQTKAVLKSLVGDETYQVVFITEQAAAAAKETVDDLRKRMTPILVPIPSSQGSLGLGMEQIRRNVEKAVGADILFGKEGR